MKKRTKIRFGRKTNIFTWKSEEPKISSNLNTERYQSEMIRHYGWYHLHYSLKDAIGLLKTHLINNNKIKELESLDNIDQWKISPTFCFIAKMLDNGVELDESQLNFYNKSLKKLSDFKIPSKYEKPVKESKIDFNLIGDMEEYYDRDVNWHIGVLFESKNINYETMEYIINYYADIYSELTNFNKDEQILEAYEKYSEEYINIKKNKIVDIINACRVYISNRNGKNIEKSTQKSVENNIQRPVSVEKLVSLMKYKKKDAVLNISSIDPKKIINSNELWIYNTNTRMFGYFKSNKGFDIYRSAIKNVDEMEFKKLRKPKEILDKFFQLGKERFNILNSIKAKAQIQNERVNKHIILLKVY